MSSIFQILGFSVESWSHYVSKVYIWKRTIYLTMFLVKQRDWFTLPLLFFENTSMELILVFKNEAEIDLEKKIWKRHPKCGNNLLDIIHGQLIYICVFFRQPWQMYLVIQFILTYLTKEKKNTLTCIFSHSSQRILNVIQLFLVIMKNISFYNSAIKWRLLLRGYGICNLIWFFPTWSKISMLLNYAHLY